MRLIHPVRRSGPLTARGWTFIETLIVIGIVLILTASVGFMAFKYLDQAKVATARSQIETFALALNAYYSDCKAFPGVDDGLKALWEKPVDAPGWNGPYVAKAIPQDPWGHDYGYKVPGPGGLPFEVVCYGPAGAQGTEGGTPDAVISSAK